MSVKLVAYCFTCACEQPVHCVDKDLFDNRLTNVDHAFDEHTIPMERALNLRMGSQLDASSPYHPADDTPCPSSRRFVGSGLRIRLVAEDEKPAGSSGEGGPEPTSGPSGTNDEEPPP